MGQLPHEHIVVLANLLVALPVQHLQGLDADVSITVVADDVQQDLHSVREAAERSKA